MKGFLAITCLSLSATTGEAGLVLPNGFVAEELTGDALWGCQVFLCLANPNGPKAVAECVPPIDRLINECFKPKPKDRKPFPKCPQAGAGNYSRVISSPWDPCELKGMTAAPRGWIAEGEPPESVWNFPRHARRDTGKHTEPVFNSQGAVWVSSGDDSSDGRWETSSAGTLACVRGEPTGRYTVCDSDGESCRTVSVYREVVWQKPQPWTAIDTYVGGSIWNRNHFSW